MLLHPKRIEKEIKICSRALMSSAIFVITMLVFTYYKLFVSTEVNWVLGLQVLFVMLPILGIACCLTFYTTMHEIGIYLRLQSEEKYLQFRVKILSMLHLSMILVAISYVNLYIVIKGS